MKSVLLFPKFNFLHFNSLEIHFFSERVGTTHGGKKTPGGWHQKFYTENSATEQNLCTFMWAAIASWSYYHFQHLFLMPFNSWKGLGAAATVMLVQYACIVW